MYFTKYIISQSEEVNVGFAIWYGLMQNSEFRIIFIIFLNRKALSLYYSHCQDKGRRGEEEVREEQVSTPVANCDLIDLIYLAVIDYYILKRMMYSLIGSTSSYRGERLQFMGPDSVKV